MEDVISQYTTAFDELNVLTTGSFKLAGGEVNIVADDVLSFLIKAYTLGIEHAALMLAHDLSVDVDSMRAAIYKVIEGKTFEDRVADHVLNNDSTALVILVESEFHRVYNAAIQDGGQDFVENGDFGATKTWYTVRDDRVRETHDYLDGQSVPIEEEFFTFDGDHAPHPGGFTKVENNVGCRCNMWVSTSE